MGLSEAGFISSEIELINTSWPMIFIQWTSVIFDNNFTDFGGVSSHSATLLLFFTLIHDILLTVACLKRKDSLEEIFSVTRFVLWYLSLIISDSINYHTLLTNELSKAGMKDFWAIFL